MPFAPKAPIDLALQERIRVAYYIEGRTIAEMETVAGVGKATLYRWFHEWGWPLRKPMRSRDKAAKGAPVLRIAGERAGPPFLPAGDAAAAAEWRPPPGRETLKARLRRLVAHRIAILEHETMSGAAVDPEANARAIELNARTLATIEKLDGEAELCPHCRDEPPARSLSELRDELRRRLERMADEEADEPAPAHAPT
jgi:hypothetical protein